jgi:hypothetical protein
MSSSNCTAGPEFLSPDKTTYASPADAIAHFLQFIEAAHEGWVCETEILVTFLNEDRKGNEPILSD